MTDPSNTFHRDLTNFIRARMKGRPAPDTDAAPAPAGDSSAPANPVEPAPEAPRVNRGGAPFGNQNARKHGLYSKRLTPEQREALPDFSGAYALVEEVALMRVKLDEILEDPNLDPKVLLRALTVLGNLVRIDDRVRFGPGG